MLTQTTHNHLMTMPSAAWLLKAATGCGASPGTLALPVQEVPQAECA